MKKIHCCSSVVVWGTTKDFCKWYCLC